ncbi:MAG: sulfatase-like hydrolase/transferase [Xanthomonadales bacterium]|nr:sulfatase-like hydrolase/transferase [Xanthomonadales bacterium]
MRNRDSKHAALTVVLLCILTLFVTACSQESDDARVSVEPKSLTPSILLITLDTTRADSLGIETDQVATPNLEALAEQGVYYKQAYSVTPTTLPSHTSMLTGLYPADHRVRENGRVIDNELSLLPELLKARGYDTAAFVSGFPLASQFGLSRGFDHYDDAFDNDDTERIASGTTDPAVAWLKGKTSPHFMWVHYFDPHEPYEPPEPFVSQHPNDPYLGEIAYMDQELGRLVTAFKERNEGRSWKIIVVGDHGEGLGDHGEALHGNLLYQGTMRVPLIVAGSGVEAGTSDLAVSVRQVFDTVLEWSGESRANSLSGKKAEPVLAEALKPYMQYGWQPQFMAVLDGIKVISSGDTEIYDVRTDPEETNNLDSKVEPDPVLWDALEAYSIRSLAEQTEEQQTLSQETLDKLASLGYIGSTGSSRIRDDAPNPRDMVHLFRDMDIGAGLFIRQEYAAAIPVFTRILEADPHNFMAALRLAVAYSVTGDKDQAQTYFDRARAIDPSSIDLRQYQAMHYLKYRQWDLAAPLFESVLAESPDRIPALAGLAAVYKHQGELKKSLLMLQRIVKIKDSPGLEWARIGQIRMTLHDTKGAIRAFEAARKMQADQFRFHMELGILYMADQRFDEAASSLDRVSRQHPAYAMALYKRAQASVLLGEADRENRVRQAWRQADKTTRPLIENERLFRDIQFR